MVRNFLTGVLGLRANTKNLSDRNPLLPRDWFTILIVEIYCVHKLAIYVKLLMKGSSIANTNRAAISVACEMTAVLISADHVKSMGSCLSSSSGISVSPLMVNMIGKAPSADLDFRNLSLMKSMY